MSNLSEQFFLPKKNSINFTINDYVIIWLCLLLPILYKFFYLFIAIPTVVSSINCRISMNSTIIHSAITEQFVWNGSPISAGLFVLNKLRWFFYLVSPYEAMYPTLESVPRYVVEVRIVYIIAINCCKN